MAKMPRWVAPALPALSGPCNPYPGRPGAVAAGALAGLLPVDGDPVVDVRLLERPAQNLVVSMKNGQVVKNAAAGR
jgi:imidazolonepropionase-like amidohydrolase